MGYNITYPSFLDFEFIRKIWKFIFCKKGFHLFDEVFSTAWVHGRNYLHCDACGLTVIMDVNPEHSHEYELKEM